MSDRLPAVIKVMDRTDRRTVRGAPFAVLLAIASWAQPDGTGCYASHDRIGQRAHMSGRRVREHIRFLEGIGELLIESKAGPGGVNRYVVTCCDPAVWVRDAVGPDGGLPVTACNTRPVSTKTRTVSALDPDGFDRSPGTRGSDEQEEQDLLEQDLEQESDPALSTGERSEYVVLDAEHFDELRGRIGTKRVAA